MVDEEQLGINLSLGNHLSFVSEMWVNDWELDSITLSTLLVMVVNDCWWGLAVGWCRLIIWSLVVGWKWLVNSVWSTMMLDNQCMDGWIDGWRLVSSWLMLVNDDDQVQHSPTTTRNRWLFPKQEGRELFFPAETSTNLWRLWPEY